MHLPRIVGIRLVTLPVRATSPRTSGATASTHVGTGAPACPVERSSAELSPQQHKLPTAFPRTPQLLHNFSRPAPCAPAPNVAK